MRSILLIALLTFVPGVAAIAATGRTAWTDTLEQARKEGQVTIYGSDTFEPFLRREFQKRFPEIRVHFVGGRGPVIGPKILTERRAGKYLVDVVLTGHLAE